MFLRFTIRIGILFSSRRSQRNFLYRNIEAQRVSEQSIFNNKINTGTKFFSKFNRVGVRNEANVLRFLF